MATSGITRTGSGQLAIPAGPRCKMPGRNDFAGCCQQRCARLHPAMVLRTPVDLSQAIRGQDTCVSRNSSLCERHRKSRVAISSASDKLCQSGITGGRPCESDISHPVPACPLFALICAFLIQTLAEAPENLIRAFRICVRNSDGRRLSHLA